MTVRILFKYISIYLLFSIISNSIKASDTLYFVGNILIKNSKKYQYNLRFTVGKNNTITGYSLSDPGGANETKTKIVGTYDSTTSTLVYEEKDVLRSKVNLKTQDLCFVKATLKIQKNKFFETLHGDFVAKEPGKNEICATGVVRVQNTKPIKAALAMVAEQDSVKQHSKDLKKEKKDFRKDNSIKIDNNKGKELLVSGNKIKLTIWDKGKVDGDIITIKLNGKSVIEKYSITKEAKIIELFLEDKEINELRIVALNEGTLPPNTAAIKIETNLEQYPILTEAKLNEERVIYLKKK